MWRGIIKHALGQIFHLIIFWTHKKLNALSNEPNFRPYESKLEELESFKVNKLH